MAKRRGSSEVGSATREVSDWIHYADVQVWDDNPAVHPAFQPEAIAESIRAFGFVAPVIVWPSRGRLVAGHGRVQAMRLICETGYGYLDERGQVVRREADPGFVAEGAPGAGMIRVVRHEFGSEALADAYGLADNELARSASWDDEALTALVRRLDADEDFAALHAIGFDADALGKMIAEADQAGFLSQFTVSAPTPEAAPAPDTAPVAPSGPTSPAEPAQRESIVDFVAPMSVAERARLHGVINLAKRVTGVQTTREAVVQIFSDYEARHAASPEAT